MTYIISALISLALIVGSLNIPASTFSLSSLKTPLFGAFTEISTATNLADFPTTYNANLNKTIEVGTTSIPTITTLSGLTSASALATIGTITSGIWNGTAIGVGYGGTGTTSPTSNQVMLGNGSSGFKVVNGFGTSGQFLTSNGVSTAPTWQTAAIDQAANYTWTGTNSYAATSTFNGGIAGINSMLFGDGSDSASTTAASFTLTRDYYFTNYTVSSGNTINTGGFRIYVNGTLTVAGTLANNGTNGSNGANGAPDTESLGGAPATATKSYTVGFGGGGGRGLNGKSSAGCIATAGINNASTTAYRGGIGGAGGTGGGGCTGGEFSGSVARTKLFDLVSASSLLHYSTTTIQLINAGEGGAGGAGGVGDNSGGAQDGAAGGGAGSGGGFIFIAAKNITVSSTGSITANGGTGGDGGSGSTNGGDGGGGGGGGGGVIVLIHHLLSYINNGTVSVSGGSGGSAGSGSGPNGTAGSTGAAGAIITVPVDFD